MRVFSVKNYLRISEQKVTLISGRGGEIKKPTITLIVGYKLMVRERF